MQPDFLSGPAGSRPRSGNYFSSVHFDDYRGIFGVSTEVFTAMKEWMELKRHQQDKAASSSLRFQSVTFQRSVSRSFTAVVLEVSVPQDSG